MALTGLAIYKNLPKENCKECGLPTCLAFAMKVAAGQAGLDQCPRLSEEAMNTLGEASAPPQRKVKIGAGETAVEIGQETVLFRHDEKFHNPPAVALRLDDSASDDAIKSACERFKTLQFTRVGQTIHPDMIALVNDSGDAARLTAAAAIVQDSLAVPVVLMSDNCDALAAAAAGPLSGANPLLYCTAGASADELAELAGKAKAPICVAGELDAVADTVEALTKKDVKDIVISPGPASVKDTLAFLTQSRRAALKKNFRPLGYPALAVACGDDKEGKKTAAALDACVYVCKYAGVIVTDAWAPHLLVPILTARQNIYTDPQKPVQVEPRLYDIGEVGDDSPLLVTTNFSLSYYSVEAEVEASRVPCRILAVDTEGTSVLTAWAADKFNPETINRALSSVGADGKVSHRQIVIPGHVAVIAAQLGEESGWKVMIGPREASGISTYLKNEWKVA